MGQAKPVSRAVVYAVLIVALMAVASVFGFVAVKVAGTAGAVLAVVICLFAGYEFAAWFERRFDT